MGEARRKKLAKLRERFVDPPIVFEEKDYNYRNQARDALAAWWSKQVDDAMFEEMTK